MREKPTVNNGQHKKPDEWTPRDARIHLGLVFASGVVFGVVLQAEVMRDWPVIDRALHAAAMLVSLWGGVQLIRTLLTHGISPTSGGRPPQETQENAERESSP